MLSYLAYYNPPYAFNPYQAAASSIFWAGAFILLGTHGLRSAFSIAAKYVRTVQGAAIASVYLVAHLFLYGFILEGILVSAYGVPPFINSAFAYVASNMLYPVSILNAVTGLAFSPNVTLLLPPIFDISLSSFSIFAAIVIDALIVANVAKTREIGSTVSLTEKSRAYLLMPLTGIILGASCCMSLPFLLSIISPSLTALQNLIWVFYVTYFVFPPAAALVLKANLELATRIESNGTRIGPA